MIEALDLVDGLDLWIGQYKVENEVYIYYLDGGT